MVRLVVLRRTKLEKSFLERRKTRGVWEKWGGLFGSGCRLRLRIYVSCGDTFLLTKITVFLGKKIRKEREESLWRLREERGQEMS